MKKLTVTPIDYYRDWDQQNDRDIVTIAKGDVTEITVRPVRHQVAELITGVELAIATNASYGPYGIGPLKVLPDQSGFVFEVDARNPKAPDDQHGQVFHADYHSIAFIVRYKKLGRPVSHNPPRDASGFLGLHIIGHEIESDQKTLGLPE